MSQMTHFDFVTSLSVAPTSQAKPATSAPPKPVEIAIPADVAALGPEAVAAYKRCHACAEARLAQLSAHPAVAGRFAEAIDLFKRGMSNSDIVAQLTKEERAKDPPFSGSPRHPCKAGLDIRV